MKTKILFFFLPLILVLSCDKKNEPENTAIQGGLTGHSECKLFKSDDLKFGDADTTSCVVYSYDPEQQVLTMQHISAGFNCCPEVISCDVTLSKDTIIITESEKEQNCNCNCLFDLDIEIQNVAQQAYIIKLIEPYAVNMPQLIFEIDLNSGAEGEYCVVRKGYPWGG